MTRSQRAFAFNLGFFKANLKTILTKNGLTVSAGWPAKSDPILVWGARKTARRGRWVARKTQSPLIYVEDAFLRSLFPGRRGENPLGVLIDRSAPYFDVSRPTDLENILNSDAVTAPDALVQADELMGRIQSLHLSKYSAHHHTASQLPMGAVVVIDQVKGDASIPLSGADGTTFATMLAKALSDHPIDQIYIRPHPETVQGLRQGHYCKTTLPDRVIWYDEDVSPQAIFERAPKIYTVSSQFGFEAIMAGLAPITFGGPFYAGWGLSDDTLMFPRRTRSLTKRMLFVGTMMLYPKWFDPCRNELCSLSTILDQLEAELKAWRDDASGWTAQNISYWKRRHFQAFFGKFKPVRFGNDANGTPSFKWGVGQGHTPTNQVTVEDGFIRSRGLGANLVPPMSLVLDDLGIYFDATRESRLEQLIAASTRLTDMQSARADALKHALIQQKITKYNLTAKPVQLPNGHKILVPGQVEDDASIRLGTKNISTNAGLLKFVRDQNPDAYIIYKPHPDVEAGLRPGAIGDVSALANLVAHGSDPISLIDQVDEVWTMTSLMGFEALIRGVDVTCVGLPFYAGWGLTRDLHTIPRRTARPSVQGLIHATLIDYPRYYDPVSKRACPPEVVIDRLGNGAELPRQPALRLLAKLQGMFASQSHLWRR